MKNTKNFNGTQIFAGIVTLAVIAAVIGGLMIAGSPQAERARQADAQRLNELQQISYAVDTFWNTEGSLPPSLDELTRSPNIYVQSIRDPQTAVPYEYRTTGDMSYEVCATFVTPSGSGPDKPPIPAPQTFWQHGAGHTCFPLEVHPNPNVPMAPKPPPVMIK